MTVNLVLKVIALVLFLVGSFWNPPGCNLIGLGLAAWLGSELVV